MILNFIKKITFINFPDYISKNNIKIAAYCKYYIYNYKDNLFLKENIYLDKKIKLFSLKRKSEILAGRYLSKYILKKIGCKNNFLNENKKYRYPIWPNNIIGSISHSNNKILCAAIIKNNKKSYIGVDIQEFIEYKRAIIIHKKIISKKEYLYIINHDMKFEELFTLSFSAKESLFKALNPIVKIYFNFLNVIIININYKLHTFELELIKDLPYFYSGFRFKGFYILNKSYVMTFII